MKGSKFIFDYVHLLYYKCHNINPSCAESYIDSPDWLKNKKATIIPINKKDNKYFQYAVIVALNHEEIKKYPLRITKVKPFTTKYNWKGKIFHQKKMIGKKMRKIMKQLLLIFCMLQKIYLTYVLKHNSNCEQQIILLMITNGEAWHYLAVKILSALLRRKTSKQRLR